MLKIKENIRLASLTTFKIGGAARYFVDVRTEAQIQEALEWAREHDVPAALLGGGSNVLIPDDGLDMLVIRIVGNLWSISGQRVDAWAGTNLLVLIRAMAAQKKGGWEKLSGIPGSVGGAVRGNAGAFGSEIKDFVKSVQTFDAGTGEKKEFTNKQCGFSYRRSYFKDHPELIITRVLLQLTAVPRAKVEKLIEETIAEREKRHLQNVKAAGSFFMNPVAPRQIQNVFEREKKTKSREERVPAGWLIEKAGMKGAKVGGAQASMQHPNYIVNIGNATAADVLELAAKIKEEVLLRFGIQLEEEAALFT